MALQWNTGVSCSFGKGFEGRCVCVLKTIEGITGPWKICESGLLEHGSLRAFSELLLFGLELCMLFCL